MKPCDKSGSSAGNLTRNRRLSHKWFRAVSARLPGLKSLCENSIVFVGRGFSHDINSAQSVRL